MIAFLLLPFAAVCAAQFTSIIVPGFDPVPIVASIAGVNAQGETTYVLQHDTQQTTDTDDEFPGKITLVEDSKTAFFSYSVAGGPAVEETCSISGSVAMCTEVINGVPGLDTNTPINVRITGPVPGPTDSAAPASSTGGDAGGAGTGSVPSSTTSSSTSVTATSASNASYKLGVDPLLLLIMAGAALLY